MATSIGVSILSARHGLDAAAESALIEQARRRNSEAFGKIVDAYQARVYGFIKRMAPNPDDASDLTQDVFIRAFQAFDRFDGRSSLRTWLFRIAHNLCIDRARKCERTPSELRLEQTQDEGEPWELADHGWSPENLVLNEELMRVVEHAISEMSDKLRSVLILHDREDMGYEEISESVGIPIGTVKSRLFLARGFLQNRVRGYLEGDRDV